MPNSIPRVLRTAKGIGGTLGGLIFVILLENLVAFPAALSHFLLPLSILGAILGYGICFLLVNSQKLKIGLGLLAVSAIIYVFLLANISSDFTWEYWIMYACVFIGNVGFFIVIGSVLEKWVGGSSDETEASE